MDSRIDRQAELWCHLLPLAPTAEELRALSDRLIRAELVQSLMDLMVEFKMVEVILNYDDEDDPWLEVADDPEAGLAPTWDLEDQQTQEQIEGWVCDQQSALKEHRSDLTSLGFVGVRLDVAQAKQWRNIALGGDFSSEVEARQRADQRQNMLDQHPAPTHRTTRRRT